MILREKDKQQLLAIASRTLHTPLEIWAYGSRVNGDAHDTSDLDVVLRTKGLNPLNHSEFFAFKEALEESTIPILIQVFDWAGIPESFQKNIQRRYEVLWRCE
ncbi:MAG: nucleotidyltransferase domain-containing protein [Mariprofundaceae bacterium]|nr:nucleotidyltransferase domain-containing protein [Mariprofundaceae bacterium]